MRIYIETATNGWKMEVAKGGAEIAPEVSVFEDQGGPSHEVVAATRGRLLGALEDAMQANDEKPF